MKLDLLPINIVTEIPCPRCRGTGWTPAPPYPNEPCDLCDRDGNILIYKLYPLRKI